MTPGTRVAAVSIVLTMLVACGGGGGGGVQRADVPFTTFTAIAPGETVVMGARLYYLRSGTRTAGTTMVTSFDSQTVTGLGVGQLRLTYDANRNLEAVRITAPAATVPAQETSLTFSRGSDTFVCTSGVCGLQNATAFAVVIDPTQGDLGWNYQSFGTWNEATSPTTFRTGAMTVGSASPVSGVPTMGQATFTGISQGFYVDAAGASFSTAADMTAMADFQTRSMTLTTFDTQLVSLASGAQTADPTLNLSGILTWGHFTGNPPEVGSPPRFVGNANTTSGLQGLVEGSFYGPNAEEIGGTYALRDSGSSVRRMIGAFGGKR